MMKQIMDENKTFTATPIALPNTTYRPCGKLYEDFYTLGGNHFVQSGKFYIREYSKHNTTEYNDILIDPETLEDITDPLNPVFVGCDLARHIDITYYCGEYIKNDEI